MTSNNQTVSGTRNHDESRMKDEFIRTGKIPVSILLKKGLWSLMTDPWFTWLKMMTGPVGLKLRQLYWNKKFASAGNGVVIEPDVEIVGAQNMHLDNFAYIGKSSQLYAPEGYIKIGKRCHITGWILGHGGVEIGNYVGIGRSSILSVTDSHQGGHRMAGPMIPMEQRNLRYGKVVIEDDAFVGHYSTVFPGITIGQGAVVAPNSLVVANIKPWTVVMGSPAREIAKREPVKYPAPD